jgi:hypothetical protein
MMVRVYLSGDPVHDRVLRAFAEGCNGELVEGWDYKPSPVAVVFGVYKSKVPVSFNRGRIFRLQRERNLDVVVLETGYINRGDGEAHHYAAGFNGLNGRADFRNKGMPSDRAEKLGVVLKPYRKGHSIVLCGQVPWDASVEGTDHLAWIKATVERIKECSGKVIRFRPHPKAVQATPRVWGVQYSTVPFAEDLKTAHAVVTFNSNSGVEALLDGVPVFAADQGSMCWELANRSLISLDVPNKPDRSQWLADLAYCQWTMDEMRSGEAWMHLTHS